MLSSPVSAVTKRTRYLSSPTLTNREELEKNSPSLKDGVPATKQAANRKSCALLILDACNQLKL
jgi:hypothetical protein